MPVLVMSPNGAVTRKSSIAAAVASGDIAKKILIVTTDQTINDATIPATTELQILNGAVITVNSGKTLTISGEFQKPSYACFAGAGTVVIPAGGPGSAQDYSVKALTVAGLTTLGAALNEKQGNDIASATTTDIGAATGSYAKVTGTTTITGLGTVQAGTRRVIEFTGILILTHNAASLILPTGANITTVAGDVATFISEGSGNWRCVGYMRANGTPLGTAALATNGTGLGNIPLVRYENALRVVRGHFTTNGTGTPTAQTGSGWTVARTGVGGFTVTFTDAFSAVPTVAGSIYISSFNRHLIVQPSTGTVILTIADTTGSTGDFTGVILSFIAIGAN